MKHMMTTKAPAVTAAEWEQRKVGLQADLQSCREELAGLKALRASAAVPALIGMDRGAEAQLSSGLPRERELEARMEAIHLAVQHCSENLVRIEQERLDVQALELGGRIRAASGVVSIKALAVDTAITAFMVAIREHRDSAMALAALLPHDGSVVFPSRPLQPMTLIRALKVQGYEEFAGYLSGGRGQEFHEISDGMIADRFSRVKALYPDGRMICDGGSTDGASDEMPVDTIN